MFIKEVGVLILGSEIQSLDLVRVGSTCHMTVM